MQDVGPGDDIWRCRSQSPRAVVRNVDCGFGRVYFSILYEESDLFSKTEVIFLTNVVTSK